ncbi:hypothetical protein D3C80_1522760 [compost metagenome]
MNVTGCNNNACFQFNFTGRSLKSNAWCAINMSGFTDRGFHAEAERVCAGNFQLRCRADRSENSYFVELAFAADHRYLLVCCELSWLGERFELSQLITWAKQRFHMLLRKVNMSGRHTYGYSLAHCKSLLVFSLVSVQATEHYTTSYPKIKRPGSH